MALNLSGETSDEAAESCLRWYIAKTFESASKEYTPKVTRPIDTDESNPKEWSPTIFQSAPYSTHTVFGTPA